MAAIVVSAAFLACAVYGLGCVAVWLGCGVSFRFVFCTTGILHTSDIKNGKGYCRSLANLNCEADGKDAGKYRGRRLTFFGAASLRPMIILRTFPRINWGR